MKSPLNLANWRDWRLEDYQSFFLDRRAAQARLQGATGILDAIGDAELETFLAPVRRELQRLYGGAGPTVSIQMPAFNEEEEILPTLVSYTLLDVEPGLAELIVVDNRSTDRTAALIKAAGARYVYCDPPGVGEARRAGFEATAPSAKYVWMTDSDVRVVAPLSEGIAGSRRSTVLRTSLGILEGNPKVAGVSTGGVLEATHWLYDFVHRIGRRTGRVRPYSCWSGWNQFFRREPLAASGAINPRVSFGDDQYRHYQLARYAKRQGMKVLSANADPSIADLVYHSGRRVGTLGLLIRHYLDVIRRKPLPKDEFGYPIHPEDVSWRYVRSGSST